MERITIEVEKGKAKFFKDLINNFDFAEIIKVDNVVEPRVYPAADFEIRPNSNARDRKNANVTNSSQDSNGRHYLLSKSEKNLNQVRDAMAEINRIRDKNRK